MFLKKLCWGIRMTKKITNQNDNRSTLTIGDSLTIYNVNTLKEKAIKILKDNRFIEVDLEKVSKCDTAGVQLLCSMIKSALHDDKTLTIKNPSDVVKDVLNRMCLSL